jgi:putative transposase
MKKLKGVFKKYYLKEHTLLCDGYFASYIGNFSKEAAENYIRSQG